jgi:hypothetical protein
MESERRETADDERERDEGDVAVPANAAVAANVLSGTAPAEQDDDSDQDN